MGSLGFAGGYYQQFISSAGTNVGFAGIDDYPFLVDTNNTGAKLASGPLNIHRWKKRGEVSGIRLGMTMDEVVGRWGKPFGGYAPMGCLHGLTSLFYGEVSLAFEGPLLETIHIRLSLTRAGGLSITSSVVRALGTPTSSRRAGTSCCLAYVSSKSGLRLDFSEDRLCGVWLERTPLRAEYEIPGANPQGGASGRQPFNSDTNSAPSAAGSRRSS